MMLRTVAVALAAVLPLQGCTPAGTIGFLLIPDEVILKGVDTVAGTNYSALSKVAGPLDGNDCVISIAKVGDRVHMGGKTWGTVKEIYGTSPNCPYPDMPLRALVLTD